jgi:hypothetical protein
MEIGQEILDTKVVAMLDNILVRQKDSLIKRINDGEFLEALAILDAVHELWIESGYGYKMNELVQRIYDDETVPSNQSYDVDKICQDLMVPQSVIVLKMGNRPEV